MAVKPARARAFDARFIFARLMFARIGLAASGFNNTAFSAGLSPSSLGPFSKSGKLGWGSPFMHRTAVTRFLAHYFDQATRQSAANIASSQHGLSMPTRLAGHRMQTVPNFPNESHHCLTKKLFNKGKIGVWLRSRRA